MSNPRLSSGVETAVAVFFTQYMEPLRNLAAYHNAVKTDAAKVSERYEKAIKRDDRTYLDTGERLRVLLEIPQPDEDTENEIVNLQGRMKILLRASKLEGRQLKDAHKHFYNILRTLRKQFHALLTPAIKMHAVLSKELRDRVPEENKNQIKEELDSYKTLYHAFWFPSPFSAYTHVKYDEPMYEAALQRPVGKRPRKV